MSTIGAVVTDNTPAEPAEYGLLSSATSVIEDSSAHWINKFDYETLDCSATVHLESIHNNSIQVTGVVQPSEGGLYRTYYPFDVVTEFQHSTMGRTPEEVKDIVLDNARVCAQKAIEFEFWTGSLAKAYEASDDWDVDPNADGPFPNRYLASESAVDVTPTPGTGVRAKHAVALLEKALGDCGCGTKGTIHLTREVASVVNRKGENGRMETNLGTTIIAGVGYTGSGPDGSPASGTEVWAYATGPVTVRLGDLEVIPDKPSQAADIRVNTLKYIAQQPAAVTWNSCCHHAVLVDLSLDYD